jgi:uncharacterized membrane protein
MIGWAATIVLLLGISALPYFLGLVLTLPILGHATWHLYRRLVVPVAAEMPEVVPETTGATVLPMQARVATRE